MRRARAVVLALAAVLFLWNLGSYDLVAPDEPYFAEGAREMIADGEWLVPHVNGVVTTDKPPLFFWLIALFALPAGEVTSLAARLPSALAALGAVALTLLIGRHLAGERAALLGAAVLATAHLFWSQARSCQIDALLCLLELLALSAFALFRAGRWPGRRAGLVFAGACALAVLAKGPVGLLVPLGIVLVTLAWERDLRALRRFAPVAGPVLFAAVVSAWMVLATIGGGGEYSVWAAFREHVVERAVHGMHHRQPPWYFLTTLPLGLLPWTALLPGAVLLAWRRRAEPGPRFLLAWAIFVVAFFSLPTEKRGLYVLPAFPALALVVGSLLDAHWPRRPGEAGPSGGKAAARDAATAPPGAVAGEDAREATVAAERSATGRRPSCGGAAPAAPAVAPPGRRWVTLPLAACGALAAAAGVVLPVAVAADAEVGLVLVRRAGLDAAVLDGRDLAHMLVAAGLALFAGGAAIAVAAVTGRALPAALATAGTAAALYLVAATLTFPALDPARSARAFALVVRERTAEARAAGHDVAAFGAGNLPDALALYSGGVYFRELRRPKDLADHVATGPEAWVVMSEERLDGLRGELLARLEVVERVTVSRRAYVLARGHSAFSR